jgi:hypothetical protein
MKIKVTIIKVEMNVSLSDKEVEEAVETSLLSSPSWVRESIIETMVKEYLGNHPPEFEWEEVE